jgi:hypothetical protein
MTASGGDTEEVKIAVIIILTGVPRIQVITLVVTAFPPHYYLARNYPLHTTGSPQILE